MRGKADIVVCGHGIIASNDAAHIIGILRGMNYKAEYVARSCQGREDVNAVLQKKPEVVAADPSIYCGGGYRLDNNFINCLEKACRGTGTEIVWFSQEPEALGKDGILKADSHPLIISTIEDRVVKAYAKA